MASGDRALAEQLASKLKAATDQPHVFRIEATPARTDAIRQMVRRTVREAGFGGYVAIRSTVGMRSIFTTHVSSRYKPWERGSSIIRLENPAVIVPLDDLVEQLEESLAGRSRTQWAVAEGITPREE